MIGCDFLPKTALWVIHSLHSINKESKELVFNTPTSSLNRISIRGNTIVNKSKHLELTLDNNLTFDNHITDIYKSSQQRLHAICSLGALSIAPTFC